MRLAKLGKKQSKEQIEKRTKANTGRKRTEETKRKMSEARLALRLKGIRTNTGKTHFKKGFTPWNKGMKGVTVAWNKGKKGIITAWNKGIKTGKKPWNWIEDRSLVKTTDRDHQNPRYKQWKKEIHIRDRGKCRIGNSDCSGRLEAHHILSWHKHPELRYEVNNGISLCHYHHPRKREDERRLAPTFQEMVLRPAYELATN